MGSRGGFKFRALVYTARPRNISRNHSFTSNIKEMSKESTEADLGDIRAEIDQKSLNNYLIEHSPNDFAAPFVYKQFGFGQSNPSYQIVDGKGRKYVLRKQPPGELISKSAHRVDREFYMIKALYQKSDVPVPKVLLLCQDKNIIGSDFYIMEFCQGRIFHNPALPQLSEKDRRECWSAALTTLARLHSVDPTTIDLNPMFLKGKLGSHYNRQVRTLAAIEHAQAQAKEPNTSKTLGRIPEFDRIISWLSTHLPQLPRSTIVHGDYKIDNLVYHATENRVIAILDWELCTIGHPLADLGNLLQPLSIVTDKYTAALSNGAMEPLKGASAKYPGLPEVPEALNIYRKEAGWDPSVDWTFAVVYAHLRLSVIAHGIAARVLRKQASSANAALLASSYPLFAHLATQEIANAKDHQTKL